MRSLHQLSLRDKIKKIGIRSIRSQKVLLAQDAAQSHPENKLACRQVLNQRLKRLVLEARSVQSRKRCKKFLQTTSMKLSLAKIFKVMSILKSPNKSWYPFWAQKPTMTKDTKERTQAFVSLVSKHPQIDSRRMTKVLRLCTAKAFNWNCKACHKTIGTNLNNKILRFSKISIVSVRVLITTTATSKLKLPW